VVAHAVDISFKIKTSWELLLVLNKVSITVVVNGLAVDDREIRMIRDGLIADKVEIGFPLCLPRQSIAILKPSLNPLSPIQLR